MELTDIVVIITVLLIAALNTLVCQMYKRYTYDLKDVIDTQAEVICEMYETQEILSRYCLTRILIDSVEKEDYKTAEECKKILDKLNIWQNSN